MSALDDDLNNLSFTFIKEGSPEEIRIGYNDMNAPVNITTLEEYEELPEFMVTFIQAFQNNGLRIHFILNHHGEFTVKELTSNHPEILTENPLPQNLLPNTQVDCDGSQIWDISFDNAYFNMFRTTMNLDTNGWKMRIEDRDNLESVDKFFDACE